MEKNMKRCINCAYGGSCFLKYNNVVPCTNNNVVKKELIIDHKPYRNYTTTELVVENNTAETCEYFIPHVDIDDEDVEVEVSFNITHKCPYCGNEDTEFGKSSEDSKIIECSNCGKKYKISWCYEG